MNNRTWTNQLTGKNWITNAKTKKRSNTSYQVIQVNFTSEVPSLGGELPGEYKRPWKRRLHCTLVHCTPPQMFYTYRTMDQVGAQYNTTPEHRHFPHSIRIILFYWKFSKRVGEEKNAKRAETSRIKLTYVEKFVRVEHELSNEAQILQCAFTAR